MARTELSAALQQFEKVVARMRELGVASWTNSPVGDITLGPPPPAKPVKQEDVDPKEMKRMHYSTLFNRQVTDPELEKLP